MKAPLQWRPAHGLLAAAVLLMAPTRSHAATYTFTSTAGGATTTDGSGGMGTAAGTTNWRLNNAGNGVLWANNNDAVIGSANGAAGTITLSGNPVVNNITFNAATSGNYILTASTLRIGSAANQVVTFTVNSGVTADLGNNGGSSTYLRQGAGNNGIIFTGGGTMLLSYTGTATPYTGPTTIQGGTAVYVGAGFLSAGNANNLTSGTLGSFNSTAREFTKPTNLKGNFKLGAPSPRNGDLTFGTGAFTLSDGNHTITVDTITATINSAIGQDVSGRGLAFSSLNNGKLTLNNTEAYTGLTTINSGTLTLGASGALDAASAGVSIAAGGTFDVSAQPTWTLGSTATLTASGTGTTEGTTAASIKGGTTVDLGTRPINLTWSGDTSGTDSTHPPLLVSQGELTLNNNAFTINGSPLGVGVYTLISVTGGTINEAGSPDYGTPAGTAIDDTNNNVISRSGNSIILTVTSSGAPTTTVVTHTTGSNNDPYGTSETFTATISPTPGDNGTVQWVVDGANSGSPVAVTGGIATLTTSTLSVNGGVAHTIRARYIGAGGFGNSKDDTGVSHTVTPRPISITADNDSKTYGDTKTYGAGQTNFTISSGTLASGESISTVTITASGGTTALAPATTYDLTPSAPVGAGGFNTANYTITPVNGTLTVNPLVLTFTGVKAFDGIASATAAQLTFQNNLDGTNLTKSGSVTLADSGVGSQSISSFAGLSLGGSAAGNYTLTGATGSVNITAVPSGSLSTIAASPTTLTADGTTTSTITVTVFDNSSIPIEGQTVALGVDLPTGVTLVQPVALTDINGQTTGTIKSTKAEVKTVSATIGGAVPITSGDATITFTAGAVTAAQSTVSASPSSVEADGSTTSTITVTVKDANSNPVSGKTVTLAKTSGPGTPTITTTQGTSDSSGAATFTVKSITAGADVFTATDVTDGNLVITQTATVTFTPGALHHFAFAAISAQTINVPFDVVITAQDVNDNTVTSFAGTVDLTTTAGTIAPTTSAAFSSGTRTESVTVTSSGTGRTITATNTSGPETGTSGTFDVGIPVNYRTISGFASGDWNGASTWEADDGLGGAYVVTAIPPSATIADLIEIRTGNVTVSASVAADQLTVSNGAILTVAASQTLTIFPGAGGIQLDVKGTVVNAGTISSFVAAPGTITTVTTSPTVAGSGFNALGLTAGCALYNSTGAIVGLVSTVDSDTQITLARNAVVAVTSAAWKYAKPNTIDFESTADGGPGLYQHNQDSGLIPTATWEANSTCAITGWGAGGVIGPSWGQSFHHFTMNSPTQTAAAGMQGYLTTVNGNLTFANLNAKEWKLNSTALNPASTLTVVGDLIVDAGTGGILSLCNNTTSETANIGGNVWVKSGKLQLTNNAGALSILNIVGNLTVDSGATLGQGTLGTTRQLNFTGSGTHTYINNGTVSGQIDWSVNSPGTLDVGTSVIAGTSATFTLNSGAGIKTANVTGLAGSITVTGTKTFSSAANYAYNGTAAQVTGAGLPAAVNNLTVDNSSGVTLSASATVNGTLTLASGAVTTGANALTLASAGSVSRTSGYVIGSFQKTLAAAGSKAFEVGTANGYSPVTVNATAGTFPVDLTVKANQGAASFVTATDKLARYWTLTGGSGVTVDLSFTYLSSDVTGTPSSYKFLKNDGSTTSVLNPNGPPTTTAASISGVASLAGDWTLASVTPYDAWAIANITNIQSSADATPGGDPDGDGSSNLSEFAFNGNPLNGSSNGQIYVLTEDSDFDSPDSAKELVLTVAVLSGAPAFTGSPSPTSTVSGVTYTIQGSTDLSAFSAIVNVVPTPVTTGLPAAGSGYEYRSFSLNGSNGLVGKGFLRAKAEN